MSHSPFYLIRIQKKWYLKPRYVNGYPYNIFYYVYQFYAFSLYLYFVKFLSVHTKETEPLITAKYGSYKILLPFHLKC